MLIQFATNCTNHKAQKLTPTNLQKKKLGTHKKEINSMSKKLNLYSDKTSSTANRSAGMTFKLLLGMADSLCPCH
jgi:hypothetical protein